MSNRLTRAELEAVIGIAGDVDAIATVESSFEADEQDATLAAWESGMEKLRRQLSARQPLGHCTCAYGAQGAPVDADCPRHGVSR